jgi:pimeloyl-ACP methyl ester carboxylesterase
MREDAFVERSVYRVSAPDRTEIACERSGDGRPLGLVHGTASDRTSFAFVRPLLEERFTVIAMDRRGRGDSGDGDGYSLEDEFEDVAAVMRAAGEGAALFGHSFGGLCALNAALLLDGLPALVLYDPPIGDQLSPPGALERLDALLERGNREDLLVTFLREDAQLSEGEIEDLRSAPTWERRVEAADTIPRELRAEQAFVFDPDRYARLEVPTLMLLGSESPRWAERAAQVIAGSLPNCRVRTLEGHGHAATVTAPELLAREVETFIESVP